jgi:hypothetical protein
MTVRRRNRCANIKASRSNFASVMIFATIRRFSTLPQALNHSTKMRLLPTVINSQVGSSEPRGANGRAIPRQLFQNKHFKPGEKKDARRELISKPTKESFPLLSELDVISHHTFSSSTRGRDDPDSELLYRVDVRRAVESRDEQDALDFDYRNDAPLEDIRGRFTYDPTISPTSSHSRRDLRETRLPPAQQQRPLSVQAKHTIALVL